jgi:hypothetical protein
MHNGKMNAVDSLSALPPMLQSMRRIPDAEMKKG